MQEFLHAVEHALVDSLKALPFLLMAFFLLEYIESALEEKSASIIKKAQKTGPAAGAALGLIPQCGFSVIGSNFFAKRIITVGTLLAIYISTSDEALLVMLTSPAHIPDMLLIMGLKFVIAVTVGYAIDFIRKKSNKDDRECHHCHHQGDSCESEEIIGEEHCCNHTEWKAIIICTVKRTASIFAFMFLASFLFGYAIELVGEARLQEIMLSGSVFQPLVTALIGLIPNCAPSVILAQAYIEGAVGLGAVVSGLCTSAGVGIAMLFRVNRGIKTNLKIISVLYAVSAASGVIIHLIESAI